MKPALLIGLGNTLRGDDGVGIRVAERARTRFPELDVLSVHGLSPELAETVAHYDMLMIVDASMVTDGLRVTDVIPATSGEKIRSHAMSPAGILGLAATLYHRVPRRSVLIEVPAAECDFTDALSPRAAGQIDACLELVGSYLVRS